MATASSSWMPAAGRHNVSIGSSLAKALKARKGQPAQRSRTLPERDFYTLRYNHKPASIDPTKPGTLEVNPGKEVTTVRVERPTSNNNEVIVFKGEEKPAKEWECVLIYDEATQTFTLEKLDSLVNLNFECKAPPRTRTAASPPTASSSSAQTPQRSPVRTAADELEAQLEDASSSLDIDGDADADGEPDPSFLLAPEEEGQDAVEGPSVHHTPTPRPSHKKAAPLPPTQQVKSRPAPSKKSAPPPALSAPTPQSAKAARVSAVAAPGSSSKPKPKPVLPPAPATAAPPHTTPSSTKRSAAAENPDVEDFEIRGPIAPVSTSTTKRTTKAGAPPASGQASSFSLALPTASAGPDPLAHQGLYGGTSATSAGPMESDDEWDEVLAPSQHTTSEQTWSIPVEDDAEAEADDGLDFLERELLGEDEPAGDGDADADGDGDEDLERDLEDEMIMMVDAPATGHVSRVGGGGGPVSMNQFAGGDAPVEDDDDDYSSSEESDED
ncbi:RNA polymerase II transcription elongation factor-domain-containing protein [Lactifluus subvellereus]|nr:RNA polymerase II transcription elongation factor-domain-containing protein [Lactifluus subvellereus]